MSFTPFIKPYPDGYEDFEVGGTPVTAEILNTNYDGFLLALNSWAAETESDIASKANSSDVGEAFSRVGSDITELRNTISQKSIVSISDLLSAGTKIGTITINGTDYDLYAPSGGGGGSSVSWNQIVSTGTKIATVTIDGVPTDVYVPTPIDELSNLTDVSITNVQNGQILKWNSTTLKWENSNESGGGSGHTIIDENGTSMTARAGLQFVGADVSDDATNNKTIVDLASAGGIDGVFVDTDNVIVPETTYSGSLSYTATEDCVVFVNVLATSSGSGWVYIDNKLVGRVYFAGSVIINGAYYLLKKGQTLTAYSQTYSGIDITYAVYGIQTGTTHSKFQPIIYSTEEREIGVWTDGKPLYKRTYELSSSFVINAQTWGTTSIDVSFVDKIIGEADIVTAGGQGYVCFTDISNNNLQLYNPRNDAGISVKFITIQYTKSTDTAGSGSWTPQGVPTHNFSTDERVIGTYLGETLYEKTYVSNTEISISAGNQGNNVSSLIDNLSTMAQVVNCFATNEIANGCMPLVADNSANGFVVYTFVGNSFKKLTVQYTKTS